MYEKLKAAARHIQEIHPSIPKIGIVLGSGLGAFVNSITKSTKIPYSEIPFFTSTTVEGHEGCLILGEIAGVSVAVLQGRSHGYEGVAMDKIVFPIRVLSILGIENLILTNAAGGINHQFNPGDLVDIKDHINLLGTNPLVGPNIQELGPRFPDMTKAYNPTLRNTLKEAAKEVGFEIKSGVYCALLGPTYETPAEINMLRVLGADMVGMSTVPEVIAANHLGVKVCGISCITNMAAGIKDEKLSHDDVKDQAKKVMELFSNLLIKTVSKIGKR